MAIFGARSRKMCLFVIPSIHVTIVILNVFFLSIMQEQWYIKGSKLCTASGILENKLRNLRRSKVKEEEESVMISQECDEGTSSENTVPVTYGMYLTLEESGYFRPC